MGNLPGAKNFHIRRNSLKLNSTTAKTVTLMGNAAVSQKRSAEELGNELLIQPPARSSASPSPLLPSEGDGLLPAHRHHGGEQCASVESFLGEPGHCDNWTGSGEKTLPNPEFLWRFEELLRFTRED